RMGPYYGHAGSANEDGQLVDIFDLPGIGLVSRGVSIGPREVVLDIHIDHGDIVAEAGNGTFGIGHHLLEQFPRGPSIADHQKPPTFTCAAGTHIARGSASRVMID